MEEREERINKLAKSLRQSGFSSSDSSALEKAKEMVEIEERIKKSQEDKDIFEKSNKKIRGLGVWEICRSSVFIPSNQ